MNNNAKKIIKTALTKTWRYVKRVLIWLDQGVNVVFLGGYEDESMSSRFYRWSKKEGKLWKIPATIVNTIFFFDYIKDDEKKILHCEKSYQNEYKRTGCPVELRGKN